MAVLPKRTNNSWSVARGYHIEYHCINAAIFRDVSLFEGSMQIPEKEDEPYSIDPSTDRFVSSAK